LAIDQPPDVDCYGIEVGDEAGFEPPPDVDCYGIEVAAEVTRRG
jgi:hypothetical protein